MKDEDKLNVLHQALQRGIITPQKWHHEVQSILGPSKVPKIEPFIIKDAASMFPSDALITKFHTLTQ